MKKYDENAYAEEDYLLISGIQHYMFCKHQWGLIHIESMWIENTLTYEGRNLHERTDNPEIKESRGSTFNSRGVAVISKNLGMQGVIDIIEFVKDEKGIFIEDKNDFYFPTLIEYKRGNPKEGLEDKVQLTALAIAFEEMKNFHLDYGYLYYFKTNRREKVYFTEDLRNIVFQLADEMHRYFDKLITPPPHKIKGCKSCSFYPYCSLKFGEKDAAKFINTILNEDEKIT